MRKRMLVNLQNCQITEFDKDFFRIGREGGDADFIIKNICVSRVHCDIITREDGFRIIDRNSRNGTSVNGIPLVPGQEHPLATDDIIRIGDTQYLFLAPKGEDA